MRLNTSTTSSSTIPALVPIAALLQGLTIRLRDAHEVIARTYAAME